MPEECKHVDPTGQDRECPCENLIDDTECTACEGSGIVWCDHCGDPEHAGECGNCGGTGTVTDR
jgi:hypothetical protein